MSIRFALILSTLGLAALLPSRAMAQAIEDTTVHQRFACLQRERELEPLADKTPDKQNNGLVRLKLRFVKADAPPKVEVLHRRGDADMLRLAQRYVEGYRLPCLHGQDHPVEVVQEFSFSRWGTEAPVALQGGLGTLPLAKPRHPFDLGSRARHAEPGKVLVNVEFLPNQEEPKVKLVFNGSSPAVGEAVASYVRQYRLDDSADRSRPFSARQTFVVVSSDTLTTKYRLNKDSYGLLEFMKMSSNAAEDAVDFDLNSMSCPFDLRVNLRQPYEAHQVFEIGPADPNRAVFLNWLSKLKLRFPSEAMQKDLFDTDVRVQVPCGRLDLRSSQEAQAAHAATRL